MIIRSSNVKYHCFYAYEWCAMHGARNLYGSGSFELTVRKWNLKKEMKKRMKLNENQYRIRISNCELSLNTADRRIINIRCHVFVHKNKKKKKQRNVSCPVFSMIGGNGWFGLIIKKTMRSLNQVTACARFYLFLCLFP